MCSNTAPSAPTLVYPADLALNPTQLTWSLDSWGYSCNTSATKGYRLYVGIDTWPTNVVAGKEMESFFSFY